MMGEELNVNGPSKVEIEKTLSESVISTLLTLDSEALGVWSSRPDPGCDGVDGAYICCDVTFQNYSFFSCEILFAQNLLKHGLVLVLELSLHLASYNI